MVKYMRGEDGRLVPVPDQNIVEMEESEEQPEQSTSYDPREDMSDLTRLDDKDINHLFDVTGVVEVDGEEDDLSDLVEVDTEDIMGVKPESPKKSFRITRAGRRSIDNQPPSMGGIQS